MHLIKEKGFTRKKTRLRYHTETKTGADNVDDLVLPANIPFQAESQLFSQEPAVGGIGTNVNANKTKYFKQNRAISTLRSRPLKSEV